jgi:protein-S-isoprenylcysteine O-methyltransferase Ste14
MMTILLLAYYLMFFGVAFALPTWRLWKQHRINGLVLPRDDTAYGLIGRWFKVLIACIFVFTFGLASGVDLPLFGPIKWMQTDALRWTGYALLAGSAFLIALAQHHLGKSWRIGIDESLTTDLVTHGLFAKSRNPIFLGMRVNMMGLFLVAPCAVTLSILLVSEALIAVQVRLEEGHLARINGDPYLRYQEITPRWF